MRVGSIQFELMERPGKDWVHIFSKRLFNADNEPANSGPIDPRLGPILGQVCQTCNEPECTGHFGYITLPTREGDGVRNPLFNSVMTFLPVKPNPSREIAVLDGTVIFDDITLTYVTILSVIEKFSQITPDKLPEMIWNDYRNILQFYINILFENKSGQTKKGSGQPYKGYIDYMKGKQGLLRRQCLGKRTKSMARTVFSVDPNLSIDEIGVPEDFIECLETQEPYTVELAEDPRFLYVIDTETGQHFKPKYFHLPTNDDPKRYRLVRPIQDGDWAMMNRAPSLHKYSILAFRIKLLPGKTLRLNPMVCAPFNADCFRKDTLIFRADGTTAPIQDIKIGDEVMSVGPNGLSTGTVTQTFKVKKPWSDLRWLQYGKDSIVVTKEHLIFDCGRSVEAGDIKHATLPVYDIIAKTELPDGSMRSYHASKYGAYKNPEIRPKLVESWLKSKPQIQQSIWDFWKREREAQSEFYRDWYNKVTNIRGKTSLEIYVEELAKANGFDLEYVGTGNKTYGGAKPDFVIESRKAVIEVWPDDSPWGWNRDEAWKQQRSETFAKAGYKCYFIEIGQYTTDDEILRHLHNIMHNGLKVEISSIADKHQLMSAFRRYWPEECDEDGVWTYNVTVEPDHSVIIPIYSAGKPWRGVAIHQCDGDAVNIIVPQSDEAKWECEHLMAAGLNIKSVRHGKNIIGPSQDYKVAAWLQNRGSMDTKEELDEFAKTVVDTLKDKTCLTFSKEAMRVITTRAGSRGDPEQYKQMYERGLDHPITKMPLNITLTERDYKPRPSYREGLSPGHFWQASSEGRISIVQRSMAPSRTGYMQRKLIFCAGDLRWDGEQVIDSYDRTISNVKFPDMKPGTYVGILMAQSFGELSTQTVLRAFHRPGEIDVDAFTVLEGLLMKVTGYKKHELIEQLDEFFKMQKIAIDPRWIRLLADLKFYGDGEQSLSWRYVMRYKPPLHSMGFERIRQNLEDIIGKTDNLTSPFSQVIVGEYHNMRTAMTFEPKAEAEPRKQLLLDLMKDPMVTFTDEESEPITQPKAKHLTGTLHESDNAYTLRQG